MINRHHTEITNEELNAKVNPKLLEQFRDSFTSLDESKRKEIEASLGNLFLTDNIKKKIHASIERKMKINDLALIILAFIGIITNVISSSLYLTPKIIEKKSIILIPNETNTVFTFRLITSITTIFLLISVIRHYNIKLEMLIFKQNVSITSSLYSTGLLWKLFAELVICAIHSPPWMNDITITFSSTTGNSSTKYVVDIDLFLSSLIPLRVYLLFKLYSFYSPWADDRAQKICNECSASGGMSFAIKAELKERPFTLVGILIVLSILIFGFAIRNVELGFMKYKSTSTFQDWSKAWNGFWCVMVTILTVGYGDFYPSTVLGRVIAVISCLWGTFLISLMVVSLTITVEFTAQEQKAYESIKKREMYMRLKKRGLELIRSAYKAKLCSTDIVDDDDLNKFFRSVDKFKRYVHEFRMMRKYIFGKEHETTPENILYKLNENVSEEMDTVVYQSNSSVNTLIEYMKLSDGIQGEIHEYVDKLDKMTRAVNECIEKNDK